MKTMVDVTAEMPDEVRMAESIRTWIATAVGQGMAMAEAYFVPAQEAWLAEMRGDLGIRLWAMGPTEKQALAALEDVLWRDFSKQLAGIRNAERGVTG